MITSEPTISVGIIEQQPEIHGRFRAEFLLPGDRRWQGDFTVSREKNSIAMTSNSRALKQQYAEISCCGGESGSFELKDVAIGIQFHWERKENQVFQGSVRFVCDKEGVTAINEIGVEEYLKSVISSEMNAESPIELLKAHAITSRSWLVAMLERQKKRKNLQGGGRGRVSDEEVERWYDREDHALFDVCGDDHCQRYQGVTKIVSEAAREAVESTRGLFLSYGDEICDARFSKACGGRTEAFENAWENRAVPYLQSVSDGKEEFPMIGTEKEAEEWILGSPPAYCRTTDKAVLRQILPSFDLETTDFFRWKAEYKNDEFASLIRKKSGIDFGAIEEVVPIKRGASGRIVRLKIVGSKKTVIVGKELEIRRWLSPSHLYSSAFVVKTESEAGGPPRKFVLHGAGWGHGVGLCQIGAAVMATEGKKAEDIVKHYFKNAQLKTCY